VIEPNRLSSPGERAALARVEAVVERLDHVNLGTLVPSRATILGAEERERLLDELELEAQRAGRADLLDDVRGQVQDALAARLAEPLILYSTRPVRADDQAVLVSAIVDVVAVAVMEDRLAPETAARLSRPGRLALGLAPIDPDELASRRTVEEPSAADWAEAASGNTRAGGSNTLPVTARVVLAALMACVVGPAAVFAGVASGSTLMGIAGGLAVVAVCWLIATSRR